MNKAIVVSLLLCSTLLVGCSNSKQTSKASKESKIVKSSSVKTSEEKSSPKSEATVENSSVESTESKQAESQTVGDLDITAICNGDISSLVGNWENSLGFVITINADHSATSTRPGQPVSNLKIEPKGIESDIPYIVISPDSPGIRGFVIALFKIDFKNPYGDQSDTKRPRIAVADRPGNFTPDNYYYRK